MRIADTSTGHGIVVETEQDDSPELNVIATRIMPEWLALFARKNRDYGSGSAYELGVRGQYSDIHRKMIKLKRAMWDGEQLDFEDTDEIIKDLISHLFLTLHMFGLQREAEQAYVYTEDDAAVDAFFRMVGGDPETALKMSGVLAPPFKGLVRERAHKMLQDEQSEHAASIGNEVTSERVHAVADEVQQELMAQRLKRGTDERLYGAREARRRAREADGSPGEAALSAMAENGAYGFSVSRAIDEHVSAPRDGFNHESSLERLLSEEFAQGDFEQSCGDKVGPRRIVTETQDGVTRYYSEAFPGSDREPMVLVPSGLVERLQKDHHVLNKEQEAGINALAEWAFNK